MFAVRKSSDVQRDVENGGDASRELRRHARGSKAGSMTTEHDGDDESIPEDGGEVIVIDELLTYCSYHSENSSAKAIQEAVVVNFFHPIEISRLRRFYGITVVLISGLGAA